MSFLEDVSHDSCSSMVTSRTMTLADAGMILVSSSVYQLIWNSCLEFLIDYIPPCIIYVCNFPQALISVNISLEVGKIDKQIIIKTIGLLSITPWILEWNSYKSIYSEMIYLDYYYRPSYFHKTRMLIHFCLFSSEKN